MDATTLYMGLLWGAIGVGYFVYGKKQQKGLALASGVLLMALPYLIPNNLLLTIIALIVAALPFFVQV